MIKPLQVELDELVDEYVPPLIDLDQLQRLVAEDDAPDSVDGADTFDGECDAHYECRSV